MSKILEYKFAIVTVIIIMFLIAIIGALFKIMHWPGADEMFIISMFGAVILFAITLYDMIVSPIQKKAIWIISLCFAPLLIALLYVFLRNDMLVGKEELG